MYKTNYQGIHEPLYAKLKKSGEYGWMDAEYKQDQFNRLLKLVKLYSPNGNLKILELGCGDAELAIKFGKYGFDVSGIDISHTAIEWAKEKALYKNVKADFRCESVTETSFKRDTFDVVIDSACAHCIIGEDRIKLFNEVHRILKKGGIFIGETMCDYVPECFKEFTDENGLIIKNGIAGRFVGKSDDILTEITTSNFKELYSVVNKRKDDNESDDLLYVFRKID